VDASACRCARSCWGSHPRLRSNDLLDPRLQNHFWRRQRGDELRLAAIHEFKRLTSDFVTDYIEADEIYRPSLDWFKAFSAPSADIKALFSAAAFDAFKKVEIMVAPGQRGLGPQGRSANDFVDARDAALRVLYSEVIPLE